MDHDENLSRIYSNLPEWAKAAFYQDTQFNCALLEISRVEDDEAKIAWVLCRVMFESKVRTEAWAMDHIAKNTNPISVLR